MSGTTAQDSTWKTREQGEEANYIREKEKAQLAALKDKMDQEETAKKVSASTEEPKPQADTADRDFEGGFGGQEDLEDRYATTSGEH
ncbi:hypothetical protein HGRIS_013546 [Hohenbuehelia grisea]|uniref:ATPase inhibitor, mitochondrial n=1 Tax=Hohenbuehelia grisea TaxID=104357 RepID=A0ABR3IW21_9AGAR